MKPQQGTKDPKRKGRYGVYIECKKCGYKTITYYQERSGNEVESVSELKDRVAKMWNNIVSVKNSDKIQVNLKPRK